MGAGWEEFIKMGKSPRLIYPGLLSSATSSHSAFEHFCFLYFPFSIFSFHGTFLSLKMHIDTEALRAKYRAERDKRLRGDGINKYIELDSHVLVDQYADPTFSRERVEKNVEFLIVGGGWGGQLIAAKMQKAGISDLLIVEKAGDFGGVWYWNRYPGAACDTEAYIYMPLLEELGYILKEKYARSEELRQARAGNWQTPWTL